MTYDTILVPTDGSDAVDPALEHAFDRPADVRWTYPAGASQGPMAIDDQAEPTAANSIWWYGVVFAAVWGVVAWILLLFYVGTAGVEGGPSTELTVLSVAILAVNPLAIYLDLAAIEQSGVEWSPDERRWLAAAIVGIPVTVFTTFVAVAYLYRRHQHVGRP
jgi:nucleotide-binding universal stress UspA family protein